MYVSEGKANGIEVINTTSPHKAWGCKQTYDPFIESYHPLIMRTQ